MIIMWYVFFSSGTAPAAARGVSRAAVWGAAFWREIPDFASAGAFPALLAAGMDHTEGASHALHSSNVSNFVGSICDALENLLNENNANQV